MKILFIIPKLGGGGAEVLLGTIIEELHKSGHQIKLLCLHDHHETYANFPNKSFIDSYIEPIIINSKVTFKFLRTPIIENSDYKYHIDRFQPDIVHSHLFESELIAYSYLKKDIRYFSHAHNNISQLKKFNFSFLLSKRKLANFYERYWLTKIYIKANCHFIAISKDCVNYLQSNLPPNIRENVFFLPNAIQIKNFNWNSNNSKAVRIISVGNLVENKDHELLIRAFKILHDKNLPLRLDILGYGPLYNYLSSLIDELNLNNSVFLRGNVANVNEFLSNSDLFCHTSKHEAFGLAIIEAMASSLPVISTDGKGNRDLIKEGENGFMVWERDPKLLADKIELLINNPELRLKMGQNARKFAEGFGIEEYVEKLIEIYKN